MRKSINIVTLLFFVISGPSPRGWGQDVPPVTEQQLESQAEMEQTETEDDAYVLQLEHFKRHPLYLNEATSDELKQFIFLTDLQIDNLLSYRILLGPLISAYELQAVPGWDVETIKKILPCVAISNSAVTMEKLATRFRSGDHQLLVHYSRAMEKSKGFEKPKTGTSYLGGSDRIYFRFRYQYKNLLQYGVVGDKDAGEQFFNGAQKYGFDFYSVHLFARKIGKIEALALGDFTVNMGQGLIQWQGIGFKKSSDVMSIKRQSSILRPYNSTGEFYFHRGLGVTVRLGHIEATGYASLRKLSANVVADTTQNREFVSSFITSGYHRTQNENIDRNNIRQLSIGGNLLYKGRNWHIGVNGVMYQFSLPVQKRNEPYNLFAISGKIWRNFSVDYGCTYRNLHLFGEAAVDKNFDRAFVNGLLISVNPRVDVAILQRTISRAYQPVYANAFTENSNPVNESGMYAGLSIRPPFMGWRVDLYADFYKFPWIKYLVDAPSSGKDFLVQLSYMPNKHLEIFSRFRSEAKQVNQPGNSSVTNHLAYTRRQGFRTQLNYELSQSVTLRSRIELVLYDRNKPDEQNGFLTFCDLFYRPLLKRFSGNIRLQYFETDDYDSRIYAYENDVLYSYSVPAFSDQGYRYYINLNFDLKGRIRIWINWGETLYRNKHTIGNGLDEINSNHRNEIKIQCEWIF